MSRRLVKAWEIVAMAMIWVKEKANKKKGDELRRMISLVRRAEPH